MTAFALFMQPSDRKVISVRHGIPPGGLRFCRNEFHGGFFGLGENAAVLGVEPAEQVHGTQKLRIAVNNSLGIEPDESL